MFNRCQSTVVIINDLDNKDITVIYRKEVMYSAGGGVLVYSDYFLLL